MALGTMWRGAPLSHKCSTCSNGPTILASLCDGAILHLVKMWLEAPIQEESDKGKPTRRSSGNRGTPQGGVMSPLLANIYMRRFLKAWELRGNDRRFGSRVVSYADDFVILSRRHATEALAEAQQILTRIGHPQG